MSDELKKLETAFQKQGQVGASPQAKADALMAAFDAFEEEKVLEVSQGIESDGRLKGQGVEKPTLSNWRRMMNTINSKWTYSLAGSASVAVLALVVVGPNMSELLNSPFSQKESSPNTRSEIAVSKNEALQSREQEVVIAEESIAEVSKDDAPETSIVTPTEPSVQDATGNSVVAQVPVETRERQVFGAKPTAKKLQSLQGQLMADQAVKAESRARIAPAPVPGDVLVPQYQDQGRDKFEKIETNPVKLVAEEPVSTFSADVDTASYSFMRASLNNNVLPHKDSVRVEELINYFDYDYEVPADRVEPFKANVEIMPTPWNEGTKLLSIGIKGYEIQRQEAPDANLVFLIDTSGSMNAPNKLPLLRNSFKLLLSTLKADDTVSIVTYAGSAGAALQPTRASEKAKILAALDNLYAGGSTAGAEGIRQAYKLAEANFRENGVNRVILATDGDFNVGISNTDELKSYIERKRDTGITLSVLGFGQGNYNDQLMQALAQNGNGNASYIDTLSEARKVLVEEAGATLFPIAKDVKLQVEFNPALVSEYRLIGYETRALNREDFNNDKVDAGDIGAGHTVTALYEITPAGSNANLVEPLRYGSEAKTEASQGGSVAGDEYGFLKIRYKLPDSDRSTLISTPITVGDEAKSVTAADSDTRFAASVAAFGQILRGGQYTREYSYDDVIALAQTGKGTDEFGYRAEFINLVRLAQTAAALEPLKQ